MKQLLLISAFFLSALVAQAQGAPKPDLSVFPNPASDYISVQDNNDLVGQIAIIGMTGRRVKEFDFTKGEHYAIADLPKGMYLVQILDHNKQVLTTQKLNKRWTWSAVRVKEKARSEQIAPNGRSLLGSIGPGNC